MSFLQKTMKGAKIGHFKNTENCPSAAMPIPQEVCISMSQHMGPPCKPVVAKGDTVKVIAGKDKDKTGKVVSVDVKNNRVVVEGVNMITKHEKPSMSNQQGGIVNKEAPIDASNVMLVVKGVPTRVGIKVEMVEKNGKTKAVRTRVAKAKELNGAVID